MKDNLPHKTDILFKEEITQEDGKWLRNSSNKFFQYSEGYKKAGHELYSICLNNSFNKFLLLYPLIFTYRQFVELRLKEIIKMGYKYVKDTEDFPDEHSLKILWKIYRYKVLVNIEQIDKDILDNVENIIIQFDKEDPKSMVFRYPVTKAPSRKSSIDRDTIDLENFKRIIDKLIYFFDMQWEMVSNYNILKKDMLS